MNGELALKSKNGQLDGINEKWMNTVTEFFEKSEIKSGTSCRSELNVCEACYSGLRMHVRCVQMWLLSRSRHEMFTFIIQLLKIDDPLL